MMTRVNSSLGAAVVPATRATTPGWRDPRLWIGVAIVAVSVVAGVRLVGSADDSVAVWAVTEDLGVGTAVEAEHVEARSVRFGDVDDLARYLPADQPLPADRSLVRGIGAGELLPAGALGAPGRSGVLQVPIRVPVDGVPASVEVGSRVDVYVSDETQTARAAVLLLGDVAVTSAPSSADSLGAGGHRQLVLGVPEGDDPALARLVAASAVGTLTVVGRG